MVDESPTPLEELVDDRRREMLLNKTELAAQAGVHPGHLRKVLTGKAKLTPDLAAALEHVLKWPRGEINRRLGAGENEHAPPADSAERAELIRKTRELRDRHLEEAAKAAAVLARLEGRDTETPAAS